MIISIHQPAYLPWLGYLTRIAESDAFVFLDCVQFEKNSFTNRNKIKTAQGAQWLTVPVLQAGHMSGTLAELEIDPRPDWRRKHLLSIEQNYRKAPCFKDRFPRLAELYAQPFHLLADLCFEQLKFWLRELGINTRVVRASTLPVSAAKGELVLEICRHLGADAYISGPLGKGYLEPEAFAAAGVALSFQEFVHPMYPQLYGDFLPGMGVVDYWLNCGGNEAFAAVSH